AVLVVGLDDPGAYVQPFRLAAGRRTRHRVAYAAGVRPELEVSRVEGLGVELLDQPRDRRWFGSGVGVNSQRPGACHQSAADVDLTGRVAGQCLCDNEVGLGAGCDGAERVETEIGSGPYGGSRQRVDGVPTGVDGAPHDAVEVT